MTLAGIAAFARAASDQGPMEAQAQALRQTYGARVRILPLPRIYEISSTQVRQRATGEGLWPPVWGYILRHGLYGVERDLAQLSDADLRAVSYSMIRAKRIAHVQGTEEEAVRLARRWGAEEGHARRAAILHDCTKYLELDEQLALCAKYGVELDDMERGAVKLLHSKTGAALARYVFHEPEEVWQAIFWHTTGKGDMTLLEKILYIADYMEPTRDFPGVERLRELAYTDLDGAVALGAQMSVDEMTQRGSPIHPNTLAARDFLKGMDP
jgi:nicotinate-nucleotide adenylyltransferase